MYHVLSWVIVAGQTDGRIMTYPFDWRDLSMGVVAAQATQAAATGNEAAALQESIGMMINFESVDRGTIRLINIEPEPMILVGLTGAKAELRLVETTYSRDGYGGQHVTTETDLVAAFSG